MTPTQFYKANLSANRQKIIDVCLAAETSFANFQQIATAGGSVGKTMAKKLAEASAGEMSVLEILYPEDYENNDAA